LSPHRFAFEWQLEVCDTPSFTRHARGLYGAPHKRGELDSWRQRLGLERRRRWNDATITAALEELSAGQTRYPNAERVRAAGLSGLYSALERRGPLDAWAQRRAVAPRRLVVGTSRCRAAVRADQHPQSAGRCVGRVRANEAPAMNPESGGR
jgi:hypothetical protein